MSVDTFETHPSIKWYFTAAIPLMFGVLVLYFIMKRSAVLQHPYQRGVYEGFFREMATSSPSLWSRTGPRDYVIPSGRIARLKWALIRSWSRPKRKIRPGTGSDVDLRPLSNIQRHLIQRWTGQIQHSTLRDSELALKDFDDNDVMAEDFATSNVAEAAEVLSIPTATATTAKPSDTAKLTIPVKTNTGVSGVAQDRRSSSAGRNSEILTEEEDAEALLRQQEDTSGGREGKGKSGWQLPIGQ
jgi:hypothetical protein